MGELLVSGSVVIFGSAMLDVCWEGSFCRLFLTNHPPRYNETRGGNLKMKLCTFGIEVGPWHS